MLIWYNWTSTPYSLDETATALDLYIHILMCVHQVCTSLCQVQLIYLCRHIPCRQTTIQCTHTHITPTRRLCWVCVREWSTRKSHDKTNATLKKSNSRENDYECDLNIPLIHWTHFKAFTHSVWIDRMSKFLSLLFLTTNTAAAAGSSGCNWCCSRELLLSQEKRKWKETHSWRRHTRWMKEKWQQYRYEATGGNWNDR